MREREAKYWSTVPNSPRNIVFTIRVRNSASVSKSRPPVMGRSFVTPK